VPYYASASIKGEHTVHPSTLPKHLHISDLASVKGFKPPDGLLYQCGGFGSPLCRQSQKHVSATAYGFVIIIIIIISFKI